MALRCFDVALALLWRCFVTLSLSHFPIVSFICAQQQRRRRHARTNAQTQGTTFATVHTTPEAEKVFSPRGDTGFSPHLKRSNRSLISGDVEALEVRGAGGEDVGETLHQLLKALATEVFGAKEPYGYVRVCACR